MAPKAWRDRCSQVVNLLARFKIPERDGATAGVAVAIDAIRCVRVHLLEGLAIAASKAALLTKQSQQAGAAERAEGARTIMGPMQMEENEKPSESLPHSP